MFIKLKLSLKRSSDLDEFDPSPLSPRWPFPKGWHWYTESVLVN